MKLAHSSRAMGQEVKPATSIWDGMPVRDCSADLACTRLGFSLALSRGGRLTH